MRLPVSEPGELSLAQVWVVVVNWNARDDTLACLTSVDRSTLQPAHVLVVDNGSNDGSVQAVRDRFSAVEVVELGENVGFGRANNLVAEHFLADREATHLFLLNNDAAIAEDTLARLVTATERDKGVGAAVPKIYIADSQRCLWYAGGAIDWKQGSARHRGMGEDDRGQFDQSEGVSFATGCGLLLRRAVVERVGLFDPRYFFFGEDVDLSLRLLGAGYTILYCPEAVVWHKVGHSVRQRGGAFVYYHMTRNRFLTMHKHANWRQWVCFACYFPFLWGWKVLKAFLLGGDTDVARGVWRGLWDSLTDHFEVRDP